MESLRERHQRFMAHQDKLFEDLDELSLNDLQDERERLQQNFFAIEEAYELAFLTLTEDDLSSAQQLVDKAEDALLAIISFLDDHLDSHFEFAQGELFDDESIEQAQESSPLNGQLDLADVLISRLPIETKKALLQSLKNDLTSWNDDRNFPTDLSSPISQIEAKPAAPVLSPSTSSLELSVLASDFTPHQMTTSSAYEMDDAPKLSPIFSSQKLQESQLKATIEATDKDDDSKRHFSSRPKSVDSNNDDGERHYSVPALLEDDGDELPITCFSIAERLAKKIAIARVHLPRQAVPPDIAHQNAFNRLEQKNSEAYLIPYIDRSRGYLPSAVCKKSQRPTHNDYPWHNSCNVKQSGGSMTITELTNHNFKTEAADENDYHFAQHAFEEVPFGFNKIIDLPTAIHHAPASSSRSIPETSSRQDSVFILTAPRTPQVRGIYERDNKSNGHCLKWSPRDSYANAPDPTFRSPSQES